MTTMTPSTETLTPTPTVVTNILTKLRASTDEDEINLLLDLFEGVDETTLPVPELTEYVLTSGKTGDLKLAKYEYESSWDKIYDLLTEAYERIPTAPVYAALTHALDWSDKAEDEEEGLVLSLQWTTRLALLARSDAEPLADEMVTRLKEHEMWQVRQLAIEVLADLSRTDEIHPFLDDADPDVAIDALNALPWSSSSLAAVEALLLDADLDEQVRVVAIKRRDALRSYVALPTPYVPPLPQHA